MAELLLRVGGETFTGWKEIDVVSSVEGACGEFTLTLAPPPGTSRREMRAIIKRGAACEVLFDGYLAHTGWIFSLNGKNNDIVIYGRDKTADLVDCSMPVTSFSGLGLAAVARKVIAPYRLQLSVRPEASDQAHVPIKLAKPEPQEMVFDFLDRLARSLGLRFWTDEKGWLVLGIPGEELLPVELRYGENILERDVGYDDTCLYSEVTVLAPEEEEGGLFGGSSASRASGKAVNTLVSRYRPLIMVAPEPGGKNKMTALAEEQVALQTASSLRAAYVLSGWLSPLGELWPAGALISVYDPEEGLENQRLAIATAQRTFNETDGQRTRLELVPPEALLRELEPLKGADEGKGLFG